MPPRKCTLTVSSLEDAGTVVLASDDQGGHLRCSARGGDALRLVKEWILARKSTEYSLFLRAPNAPVAFGTTRSPSIALYWVATKLEELEGRSGGPGMVHEPRGPALHRDPPASGIIRRRIGSKTG